MLNFIATDLRLYKMFKIMRVSFLRQTVCIVATYRGVSPQFIVRPVDEVAVDGATVVLFCAANGRDHEGGKPNIVWLKDGAALDLV